jgi:hypothetical protein
MYPIGNHGFPSQFVNINKHIVSDREMFIHMAERAVSRCIESVADYIVASSGKPYGSVKIVISDKAEGTHL